MRQAIGSEIGRSPLARGYHVEIRHGNLLREEMQIRSRRDLPIEQHVRIPLGLSGNESLQVMLMITPLAAAEGHRWGEATRLHWRLPRDLPQPWSGTVELRLPARGRPRAVLDLGFYGRLEASPSPPHEPAGAVPPPADERQLRAWLREALAVAAVVLERDGSDRDEEWGLELAAVMSAAQECLAAASGPDCLAILNELTRLVFAAGSPPPALAPHLAEFEAHRYLEVFAKRSYTTLSAALNRLDDQDSVRVAFQAAGLSRLEAALLTAGDPPDAGEAALPSALRGLSCRSRVVPDRASPGLAFTVYLCLQKPVWWGRWRREASPAELAMAHAHGRIHLDNRDYPSLNVTWHLDGRALTAHEFRWFRNFAIDRLTARVPVEADDGECLLRATISVATRPLRTLTIPVQVSRRHLVFVSYSHADTAAVARVVKRLQSIPLRPHCTCWVDQEILSTGRDFNEQIRAAIEAADAFLLCWSHHTARSDYVRQEYRHAIDVGIRRGLKAADFIWACSLVPPAEAPSLPPDLRGSVHFVDSGLHDSCDTS